MADASHHDPSDIVHYNVSGDHAGPARHRGASFGVAAICLILVAVAAGLAFKLSKQNAALADVRGQLERTNSEMTAVRGDLAKANQQSAGLQAQLDKAKQAQTDLQAQAKKSDDAAAGLQAQLDKAQTDFKAQQDKTQADMSELQTKFRESSEGLIGANKQVDALKAENADLKAQLAKTKETAAPAQPVAAKARDLPLTTEVKKSFFGGTYTLRIKNSGSDPLKVNLTIGGAANTPARSATIEAGGTFEMKDLAAGAQVGIASQGYNPTSVTVK